MRSGGIQPRLRWRGKAPALTGTVIAVEPPHMEPPDFRLSRLLGRPLLMLLAPFLTLWVLFTLANPLILLLLLLGLFFLFRTVRLGSLLPFFFLARARRAEELLPVQYFRVRDEAGREHVVRRKGHLASGHVMPGDEVALWGRWRYGVLHLQHGLNLRTHARLVPRPSSVMAFLLGSWFDRLWAWRRGGG